MCVKACPYNAIVKISVPCEDACPVGAIKKDETGFASIDFDKCITCGKCISSCPFGAVHERSQIIDILKAIKEGKKVIAMIAPAIAGQFPGNIYQLKTAIVKAGFTDVYEVAQGADITAHNEAEEFIERMNEAKEKSEEIIRNAESNITLITAQEKEITTAFEIKANERKETLEKELEKMIADAKLKADSITAAAEDSVERQQVLFDKLRLEIAAFKSAVTSKYKEHLSILQEIPETVPMDPKKMAEVITAKIDAVPDAQSFIPMEEEQPQETENGFAVEESQVTQE